MFKKILIIFGALFLIVTAALTFFLATFNLNQFKAPAIEKLETLTGSAVTLDQLSFGWKGGIAVSAQGLHIYPDESSEGAPALTVSEVTLHLKLLPLLNRSFEIGSITIERPSAHIILTPQGKVKLIGFNPKTNSVTEKSDLVVASGFTLLVYQIDISQANLKLTDNRTGSPRNLHLENMSFGIRNFSLTHPFHIEFGIPVGSNRRNLVGSVSVRLPEGSEVGWFRDGEVSVDLAECDTVKLNTFLGDYSGFRFRNQLKGKIAIALSGLSMGQNSIKNVAGRLSILDGQFYLENLAAPIESLNVHGTLSNGSFKLDELRFHIANGLVESQGILWADEGNSATPLKVMAKGVQMSQLFPPVSPNETSLVGTLSLSSFFNFGKIQNEMGFAGEGTADIQNGTIRNFSFLREVFTRMSYVPGLVNRLTKKLPENYSKRLENKETVLEKVTLPFALSGGRVQLKALELIAQDFVFTADGFIGLDQSMRIRGYLKIDQYLSSAFISSVNELSTFLDSQNRLSIPVTISGTLSRPVFQPDVQGMVTRFAATKAQELLVDLLG